MCRDNVVLGFNLDENYINGSSPSFGAVVGRYANRIANHTFSLDGKQYVLDANDGNMSPSLKTPSACSTRVLTATTYALPVATYPIVFVVADPPYDIPLHCTRRAFLVSCARL